MVSGVTQTNHRAEVSVPDLTRAGWSHGVICQQFGCDKDAAPVDQSPRVCAHLDSMILERADEVLRGTGSPSVVAELICSDSVRLRSDALGALEVVAWTLAYEFESVDAVYGMARSSLVEQEIALLESFSSCALERIIAAESIDIGDPGSSAPDLAKRVCASKSLYGAYTSLREQMGFVTDCLESLRDISPEASQAMVSALSRVLGRSPWFSIATQPVVLEPRYSGCSSPSP